MPIQNSKLVHALLIVPSLLQMLQLLKDIALINREFFMKCYLLEEYALHRKCKMKHETIYGMGNESFRGWKFSVFRLETLGGFTYSFCDRNSVTSAARLHS